MGLQKRQKRILAHSLQKVYGSASTLSFKLLSSRAERGAAVASTTKPVGICGSSPGPQQAGDQTALEGLISLLLSFSI